MDKSNFDKSLFKITIFFAIIAGLSACSCSSGGTNDGGGGGGHTNYSSSTKRYNSTYDFDIDSSSSSNSYTSNGEDVESAASHQSSETDKTISFNEAKKVRNNIVYHWDTEYHLGYDEYTIRIDEIKTFYNSDFSGTNEKHVREVFISFSKKSEYFHFYEKVSCEHDPEHNIYRDVYYWYSSKESKNYFVARTNDYNKFVGSRINHSQDEFLSRTTNFFDNFYNEFDENAVGDPRRCLENFDEMQENVIFESSGDGNLLCYYDINNSKNKFLVIDNYYLSFYKYEEVVDSVNKEETFKCMNEAEIERIPTNYYVEDED